MARTAPRNWSKGIRLGPANKELAESIARKRQEYDRATGKKDMQIIPGRDPLDIAIQGMMAEIAFASVYGLTPDVTTDDTNLPDFTTAHGEKINVKSTKSINGPLKVPEWQVRGKKAAVYYPQVVVVGDEFYVTGYASYEMLEDAERDGKWVKIPQDKLLPIDESAWFGSKGEEE
jgi:hypothetical protein